MISAISGLPELIIDRQNDVQVDIDMNNRRKVDNSKLEKGALKENETKQKVETKDKLFNQESIDELNKELKNITESNRLNVQFKFEKEANQLIMKLIDEETKEVVRQVPAELMLKIARIVSSQLNSGAFADAKVWRIDDFTEYN